MKVTNERFKELSGYIGDVKQSLEFTQKQLEDDTKVIEIHWNITKKYIEISLKKTLKHYKKSKWNRKGSLRPWAYCK